MAQTLGRQQHAGLKKAGRAGHSLKEQSQQLKQVVSVFRIDREAALG
ncbi:MULTISPECIES: hypothetical protein [Ralstonia]|nr:MULTISPECIES: hypothetical protein [unclassified Ralstonia]